MRRLFVVAFSLSIIHSLQAADPVRQAAAAFYDGIRSETLPNGLQVVLKPVPGAATVTTFLAYKVGSSDEELSATGLSHYLEHLMFKGTDKIMPGDIDRMTLRNGGHNNAWTSEDMTTYHFDFAADRWQAVLDIEADRMRNLRIDAKHEFQQEKGAVIAELDRNEDNPFDLERKAILPRLFGQTAPYGHPVIGERPHVRGATADIIKSHYDKWYHPNNAVLVVCGGFHPSKALELITAKLGPIPVATLPERKVAPAVKRTEPIAYEFPSKFETPRLLIGYNTVAVENPDEAALTVLATALSGGKTGRLYQVLVEDKQVASSARANHSPGRYPGWFDVEVELLPDQSLSAVEALVLAEIAKLAAAPLSDADLARVKRQILASDVFSKESIHALAEDIAVGVTLRGLDAHRKSLAKIEAVTAADVTRVAATYLDPKTRVTVASNPKKADGATPPAFDFARAGTRSHALTRLARLRHPLQQSRERAEPSSGGYDLTKTQKVVLPNGLTLLLLENHRLPLVAAQVFVRGVRLSEPRELAGVASLTGSLLDEGTATRTSREIAAAIEGVGGELSLSPSGGSVHILSPDLGLGLGLLFDCLINANFPADAFARLKAQSIAALDEAMQQPDSKAQILFQSMVYGEHPLGRPALGTKETLKKLKVDNCREFHRANFVPNRTVFAVVGDFDSAAVRAIVEKLTADWKANETPVPTPPALPKIEKLIERIIPYADAAQLYLYLGHAGIRRSDPDFYSLLVMDYVLGTGPGFTDRLSSRLRDRQGLAYTVTANITGAAGEEPGAFIGFIGTYPDKLAQVKSMFLEEFRRIRNEPATNNEVEDAKRYLLGSIPFRITTSDQVAEQLLQIERFHLGFDYLDQFRQRVGAVTPADVQAVALKHLDPDKLILVAVGAVDATGKALPEKKP
jgi:zinc protease